MFQGETPYKIDRDSNKPILGQMFGTRRLNTNEDGENMLGYDLYSSALANILTEPSLAMPVTVGLYAKWGSGKSFLLGKLMDDMKSISKEWITDPSFNNSPLVFLVALHIGIIVGVIAWILSYLTIDLGAASAIVGAVTSAVIMILSYIVFLGIWKFSGQLHNMKVG